MNKPTMWVLVGLSGSGKSTIATQIANEKSHDSFWMEHRKNKETLERKIWRI